MYRQFDEFSIGVDRGGTLTRVVAVSTEGKHLRETRFPSAAEISSFTETLSGIIKEWKAVKAPLAIASRGVMSVPEVRKSIMLFDSIFKRLPFMYKAVIHTHTYFCLSLEEYLVN